MEAEDFPVVDENIGAWLGIGIAGFLFVVLLILAGVLIYYCAKSSSENKSSRFFESTHKSFDIDSPARNPRVTIKYQEECLKPEELKNIESTATEYENTKEVKIPSSPSAVILKEDLEKTYLIECENGFLNLQEQFKRIKDYSEATKGSHSEAKHPENRKSNRYKNIYSYDHSQVVLDSGKYINASVIKGYKNVRNYIATQGPKPSTAEDFWEMVWGKHISIIVMLCKCVENQKTKCEKYWPENLNSVVHGNFTIQTLQEKNLGAVIKRSFLVTNEEEERKVTQFQFVSWPDHGIPITTTGVLFLRKLVNEEAKINKQKTPIIVHCSAGAGRTGAYIALDNSIEELKATGAVDVADAVVKMRKNRTDMVQTKNQYIMVHKLLTENFILPKTQFSIEKFLEFMKDDVWSKTVEKEYQQFSNKIISLPATVPKKSSEESDYTNENETIADVNQVTFYGSQPGDKVIMNAHFIKNDHYSASLIASCGPPANTEGNFWEMIVRQKARFVVALEALGNDIVKKTEDKLIEIGEKVIIVENTEEHELYTERKLTVSTKDDDKDTIHVKHVVLHRWGDELPDFTAFTQIISKMKDCLKENEGSTALIYCENGFIKTGYFLVLVYLIEAVKCGNPIDVFRTVKDLKDMRRGMVDSLESYKSCYTLTRDYVKWQMLQN